MAELDKILGKIDVSRGSAGEKIVLTQPLLAHLCDVAAVFEEILGGAVFRRHFERIIGKPLPQSLIDRLCVLALWHDFGKISPLFQRKLANAAAPEGEKRPGSQNHIVAGLNIFSMNYRERREKLFAPFGGWDPHSRYLQRIVLSHHGTVLNIEEIRKYADSSLRCWDKSAAYDPWIALEELMVLTRSYYPGAFTDNTGELPANGVFQNLFAGTLMLADWIASDKRLFPFCGEDTDGAPRPFPAEADQLAWSRARAGRVLESIGWKIGTRRPNAVPDFAEQFGFAPNAIQREIDALPLCADGGLFFLEAETGSGKTEAALRLYTRLLSAGLVDGLYFANPRRFAATQLFERMDTFSKRSFGQDSGSAIPVTLAVPGYLRVGSHEGVRIGRFQVDWKDLGDSAPCWSAEQPKRYLAAPIASGTIDQALLAGLRVPHAHMRGAALQRSLLVVDEVHSSDAYMTRLTCGLLDLFARAGGYVLLMSATLGAQTRTEYRNRWNRARRRSTGRPLQVPSLKESVELCYPLLSSDSSDGQPIEETPICKSVVMESENCMTDPARVARLAANAVKDFPGAGPCVLILRNTVRQARATFTELQKLLPPGKIFSVNGVATIHHSRYAPEDRRLLDAAVERQFGKNVEKGCPPLDRPRKCQVLVATQTLEQSLDVDFDLLITDLCPADVLLQRIGRLFRHKRVRPKDCAEPRCIVLLPENRDWLLKKPALSYGFGEERAYGNLPALAATWDLIIGAPGSRWELPQQNRCLVEHSTHPEAVREEINRLGGEKWQETYDRYYGSNTAQKNVAENSRLKWDKLFKDTNVIRGTLAENIASRLGARDLVVKTEKPVPSPFGGQNLHSFSIPAWMLPRDDEQGHVPEPNENGDVVVAVQNAGDELTFDLGGKKYYYGVTGLQSDYEHDAAADSPS